MKKIIITIFLFVFNSYSQQNKDEHLFRLAQAIEQSQDILQARNLYIDLWSRNQSNYNYFDGVRRTSINLKDYDKAIEASFNWLKISPQDISTESSIGGIFYLAEKEKKSDSLWNAILQKNKDNEMSYRIVANTQLEYRLFDKAINTFKIGREKTNRPTLFAIELASYYSALMRFEETVKEYLIFLNEQNHQLEFIESRLAQLSLSKENLSAIRNVIKSETEKENTPTVFLRLKQWIELEAKDYQSALKTTLEINRRVSNKAEELHFLSNKVFAAGDFKTAAEFYLATKNSFPLYYRMEEIDFGLAKSLQNYFTSELTKETIESSFPEINLEKSKQFRFLIDSAITLYNRVKIEKPFSNFASQSVMEIAEIKEEHFFDIDEAIRLLDSLIRFSTSGAIYPEANYRLAKLTIKKNNLKKANDIYDFILKGFKTKADEEYKVKLKMAELYFYEMKFDTALWILNEISKEFSKDEANDAMILQNIISENYKVSPEALKLFSSARLFTLQNKNQNSIINLTQIIEQHKTAPLIDEAILLKSKLLLQNKNYSESISTLQYLLKNYPKSKFNEVANFYIGEILEFFIKDKNEAIKSYEEVITLNPNSVYADKSRKRIRILRNINL